MDHPHPHPRPRACNNRNENDSEAQVLREFESSESLEVRPNDNRTPRSGKTKVCEQVNHANVLQSNHDEGYHPKSMRDSELDEVCNTTVDADDLSGEDGMSSDQDQSFYSTLGDHSSGCSLFVHRTKIWITTVAAPPLQIYPIIRALYLIRWQLQCDKECKSLPPSPSNESKQNHPHALTKRVTILIPWIEDSNDRARIYRNHASHVTFDGGAIGRKQQIEYIKNWAIKETNMVEEVDWLKIRFYPARYDMNTFIRHLRWVQEREAKDLVILRASSRMNYLPSCSGDASRLPVSLDVLRALTKEDNFDSDDSVRIIHIDIEGNEVGYSLERIFSPETDNAYKPKLRTISYDDEVDETEESLDQENLRQDIHDRVSLNTRGTEIDRNNDASVSLLLPNTKVHREIFPSSGSSKRLVRGYFFVLSYFIFTLLKRFLVFLSLFIVWFAFIDEQYLYPESSRYA